MLACVITRGAVIFNIIYGVLACVLSGGRGGGGGSRITIEGLCHLARYPGGEVIFSVLSKERVVEGGGGYL